MASTALVLLFASGLSLLGCAKGSERRKVIIVQPAVSQAMPTATTSDPVTMPSSVATSPAGVSDGTDDMVVTDELAATDEAAAQSDEPATDVTSQADEPSTGAIVDGGVTTDAAAVPVQDGTGADGGVGPSGPNATPAGGGDCEQACLAAGAVCAEGKRCEFDCSAEKDCAQDIVCPNGFDCVVKCEGEDSCSGHIKCPEQGAESCEVVCGQDACTSGIECGGTTCSVNCANGGCHNANGDAVSGGATNFNVDCWGDGSCKGGLTCNATNCNLACNGSGACTDGNITLSAENASLACNGSGSCGQELNCNSGNCNVNCNTGAGACSTYCANRPCN